MRIRKASDRGKANFGWLNANYTFSFSRYFDKNWIGSGPLLVMNEDFIAPKSGFSPHSHSDMEILTYVLEGTLTHEDSIGNKKEIKEGEFQLMTAGTGIIHSEKNEGNSQVHLYQIWIEPKEKGLTPSYQQKNFKDVSNNSWQVVADFIPNSASFLINQNVEISIGRFNPNQKLEVNSGWIQVIKGEVEIEGEILTSSDGIEIDKEISIYTKSHSEILVFNYSY